MAQVETVTVSVNADARSPREGRYEFVSFDHRDRLRRAIGGWAGCWLVGAIAIPIPIVHFIMVPAMAILGPILGFIRYRADRASRSVNVKCPICNQDVVKRLDASDRIPLYTYCPQCDGALYITFQ